MAFRRHGLTASSPFVNEGERVDSPLLIGAVIVIVAMVVGALVG